MLSVSMGPDGPALPMFDNRTSAQASVSLRRGITFTNARKKKTMAVIGSLFMSREGCVVVSYDSKVVRPDDTIGFKARTATLAVSALPVDIKSLPKTVRDSLPQTARIDGDRIVTDEAKAAKAAK